MLASLTWPPDAQSLAMGILAAVLLASAATDVATGKIYNWCTLPAVLIGLVGHALIGGLTGGGGLFGLENSIGLLGSLLGVLVGFGPLFLAWRAGGIGGGDAKLMAAVGALVGWRFALATLFWGFAAAIVMCLVVMIRHRLLLQTLRRVWRFVALAFTPNKPADPATSDSPTIPFGLALCIGAGIQLVDTIFSGPISRQLFMNA